MRVLLIDVICKEGSTGKIVYNLYRYINDTQNIASVCYGRGEKIDEKNIYKFGYDIETYFHALMTRITGYTGRFSVFSTRRLKKYIDDFKPDVVHIHELHAYFVNDIELISYLKKNKIPIVLTLHCEYMYTGKCGHSVDCTQWMNECKKCPRVRSYPSSLLFDQTNSMFLKKKAILEDYKELIVVCPSRWLMNRAKQSFLSNHKLLVVPNGIDTSIFHIQKCDGIKEKYGIQSNDRVVLSVAPHIMSPEKGGATVVEISKRFTDTNIKFIIVGTDNKEQSTQSNLIFVEKINDPVVLAQFYSMADVFLICSERENFPTTCLEAQCCGALVCGFDTGGTKETSVIKDDNLFAEYMDIDNLEKIIWNIFENKDSKIKKEDISKLAIGMYSVDSMCNSYMQIYRSLLKKDERYCE